MGTSHTDAITAIRTLLSVLPGLSNTYGASEILTICKELESSSYRELKPKDIELKLNKLSIYYERIMTSYHEAGHLCAIYALFPESRIEITGILLRIKDSDKHLPPASNAAVYSTQINVDLLDNKEEIIRYLAVIRAGKYYEPNGEEFGNLPEYIDSEKQDLLLEEEYIIYLLKTGMTPESISEIVSLFLKSARIASAVLDLGPFILERWNQGEKRIRYNRIEAILNNRLGTRGALITDLSSLHPSAGET